MGRPLRTNDPRRVERVGRSRARRVCKYGDFRRSAPESQAGGRRTRLTQRVGDLGSRWFARIRLPVYLDSRQPNGTRLRVPQVLTRSLPPVPVPPHPPQFVPTTRSPSSLFWSDLVVCRSGGQTSPVQVPHTQCITGRVSLVLNASDRSMDADERDPARPSQCSRSVLSRVSRPTGDVAGDRCGAPHGAARASIARPEEPWRGVSNRGL